VDVQLARSLVSETVNEPRVRVEVKYDGLVVCEDGFPFSVREAVGMVDFGNQLEKIDNVNESDL